MFRNARGKLLDTRQASAAVMELLRLGFYTHAQRAYLANRLLKQRPHLANRLALRFPELIIDEAQDTKAWLLRLLDKLREQGARITLVGDPDQCIYSFAMADAASLFEMRDRWGIPEIPLDKSFRCNDPIAEAVRSLGSNSGFTGCGPPSGEHRFPFILRETNENFRSGIDAFSSLLAKAGIAQSKSAIICRAHDHLESVRGQVNYADLEGLTKRLAQSAFARDCHKDYKVAFDGVESVLRELIWDYERWAALDEAPESSVALRLRELVWKFIKNDKGLPPVSMNGEAWIATVRDRLSGLIADLGGSPVTNLSSRIHRRGLASNQFTLPLFEEQKLFPSIRQDTIHQVKGESIDAVLVIGSTKFWNSVVNSVTTGVNSEDRRLAYVAMTRAKHLLVLCLPSKHYDAHIERWRAWGFRSLDDVL